MWSFSQNTYPKIVQDSLLVITPTQLKQTNLIFLDHKRLVLETKELRNQVNDYSNLMDYYSVKDSLKSEKISILLDQTNKYKDTINSQNIKIDNLESKNTLFKGFTIGSISISVALLITLFLK